MNIVGHEQSHYNIQYKKLQYTMTSVQVCIWLILLDICIFVLETAFQTSLAQNISVFYIEENMAEFCVSQRSTGK